MSFLDRLSKGVTDLVDKGKREVDQMQRISKVRGEIRDLEKQIADFQAQIQATKVTLGEKAMEMLKAGTLTSPDLQPLLDTVTQCEQGIVGLQAQIAEKERAIEAIKAEDQQPKPAPEATQAAAPVPAPQAPAPAGRFCSQCGAAVAPGAAFCSTCGAKQG